MPPPAPFGSGDAGVCRASQLQHAVEDVDGNVHLGRPTLVRVRAQPVADHLFEPAHGGLGPGAEVVPGGFLPAHAARLGDRLQMPVALCRRGHAYYDFAKMCRYQTGQIRTPAD